MELSDKENLMNQSEPLLGSKKFTAADETIANFVNLKKTKWRFVVLFL